ncbi:hypothetical protein [Pedobacter sp. MW01-1-1]|uniref:hypothetical protein n=1 Tax=Pedobacter sp. MW01-1-1 TaxID=3383027 RepID=UPI003FED6D56
MKCFCFCLFLGVSFLSCKKSEPAITKNEPTVAQKKDYSDFGFDEMAARSGYYIKDTIWTDGEIKGFSLSRNLESPFLYPFDNNNNGLYLGLAVDGEYFKESNGQFKEYLKFSKSNDGYVRADAYYVNLPRDRRNVKINELNDVDSLVKDYLLGQKPSVYGFSRYLYHSFSSYNQLRLFFGENIDIRKLFNVDKGESLSKDENGLVCYNVKETIGLKFMLDNRPFFTSPFSLDELKRDEASYISKVTYGKVSIMTIRSTLEWRALRAIVEKVSVGQALSSIELDTLKTAKAYTCLIGYSLADQEKMKRADGVFEIVKTFLSITNVPTASNKFDGGTFSYGDYGVPLFFEVNSAYSSSKFLKNFTYSKTIKF